MGEMVRYLVESGVDVTSKFGQDAITEAARQGQSEVLRYLAETRYDLRMLAGQSPSSTAASQDVRRARGTPARGTPSVAGVPKQPAGIGAGLKAQTMREALRAVANSGQS